MTENDKNSMETKESDEIVTETEKSGGNAVETEEMQADVAKDKNMSNFAVSSGEEQEHSGNWNIDLLLDVELPVRVSFGQTEMQLRDVFKLGAGSVIELDKLVNDPVAVIVNNKTIAKGEVVMVDGNYGVRILEVESTADRIRSLG